MKEGVCSCEMPELAKSFMETMHRFRRLHIVERLVKMPHSEFITMNILGNETLMQGRDGMRVSELAAILKNSPAASSKMLSVLEDKGYVERFFGKKDRRNTYVKLTKAGTQKMEEEHMRMNTYVRELEKQLGEKDCQKMMALIKRSLDITEKYLEKQEGTVSVKMQEPACGKKEE